MNERPAWSHFQGELERRGFRPSRRFGQNFLLDENMLHAIARDAELAPGACVLEVGPGLGFLTRHLLLAGARVVCVEIDARLLEIAREWLGGERGPTWVHADVLDGKHALAPAVLAELPAVGEWHLVSNLPYSAAAPLLAVLADLPNPPRSMTVLVQREVADRIVAAPGSGDWGLLSLALQGDYQARRVRDVPPQLFWPRPEVDSSVVRLVRRSDPLAPALRRELQELAARLFQRRRQTLGRVLGEVWGRERAQAVLAELGWPASRRGEELDLGELVRLVEAGRSSAPP